MQKVNPQQFFFTEHVCICFIYFFPSLRAPCIRCMGVQLALRSPVPKSRENNVHFNEDCSTSLPKTTVEQ